MSQRDRDARAAMREILRAGLQLAKVADCASLAEMAWSVADAMATERRKREAAEAPTSWPHARDPAADLARAMEHLKTARNEELEAARREGRDAGLREAADAFENQAHIPEWTRDEILWRIVGLMTKATVSIPDVASLQAELAKLRAVAEAAAQLQRWRKSDDPVNEGMQADIGMTEALDAALPGWRTK